MKHFFNAHFLQFVTGFLYEIDTKLFSNFFKISKSFDFFDFSMDFFSDKLYNKINLFIRRSRYDA